MSRIWLAAHWDKKLTKTNVFDTNIEKSIERIINPNFYIGLRTSGHLLFGVVRIYSRKAKYLLVDCNEACFKMKLAFRPEHMDLLKAKHETSSNAITLPDDFLDFDITMPALHPNQIMSNQFNLNQTSSEDITLRETYDQISLEPTDNSFGSSELCNIEMTSQDHFGNGSLFGPEFQSANYDSVINSTTMAECHERLDVEQINANNGCGANIILFGTPSSHSDVQSSLEQFVQEVDADQTILLQNEDEEFALAPVNPYVLDGTKRKPKRRQIIVDQIKGITREEMKGQLKDTTSIKTLVDLAPPTKWLMQIKEIGAVAYLFALPGRSINSRAVVQTYINNMSKMAVDNQTFGLKVNPEGENSSDLQSEKHLRGEQVEQHARNRTQQMSDIEECFAKATHEKSVIGSNDLVFEEAGKENEADEQIGIKRAAHFKSILKSKFRENQVESLTLSSLTRDNNRKQVVQKVYSLLVLHKVMAVGLEQDEFNSELNVSKGPNFNTTITDSVDNQIC